MKGECDYKDCIVSTKDGIDVLPSWEKENNSSELLGSEIMAKLLEKLEKEYDVIIMDTPPSLALSDVAFLSKHADGVILVIRQEQTEINSIINVRDNLQNLGVHIIGSILNDIRYTSVDAKYRYKYKYD